MLAEFENVLGNLKVAWRNGDKAMCFCPAHDDRKEASLSVKAEDGKVLLHCFAGCRPEDVIAAVSLKWSDLFAEGGGGVFYLLQNDVNRSTGNAGELRRLRRAAHCVSQRPRTKGVQAPRRAGREHALLGRERRGGAP